MKNIIIAAALALCSVSGYAQKTNTTAAEEALTLARRANDYFMQKWSDPTEPTKAKKLRPSNLWTRAVYYEGLLALNDIDPQQRYLDYTDTWANFHKWQAYSKVETVDADHQCCFQAYLTRWNAVGDKQMVESVMKTMQWQMQSGSNSHWTWIDAIQMAMPAYIMMYGITEEQQYADYAMQSYVWTRDTLAGGLFDKEAGLWWRDKNFVAPYKESDGKNCYWSRGNGWVFAALTRCMMYLPKKDKYHKLFKKDFLRMAKALVPLQREDGFWNASLASQDFAGKELTGTALFLYGLSYGISNGYLDEKTYGAVADKAWNAVASCIHNDGFVGYVQGSGDRPASNQPVTYVKEPDFDDYGLGCFLLGATEYYKLRKGISTKTEIRKYK